MVTIYVIDVAFVVEMDRSELSKLLLASTVTTLYCMPASRIG